MAKSINHTGVTVLVAILISLVFGTGQGIAADWQDVLREAKAKYATFEKEIKDMNIVQETKTVLPEAGEISFEAKVFEKGNKFRIEATMQMPNMPKEMGGIPTVIICDGKDTWMISSMMGKKKLTDEESKQYQTRRNWWVFLPEEAQIVGIEKIGSLECYVVEIKEKNISPFTKVWMDKENLVLIRAEIKSEKEETMLMEFSDFRKIKGNWEMPYKTEMYLNKKLMSTTIVRSIEINKGLSDDLFAPDNVKVKGSMQDMMKR